MKKRLFNEDESRNDSGTEIHDEAIRVLGPIVKLCASENINLRDVGLILSTAAGYLVTMEILKTQ